MNQQELEQLSNAEIKSLWEKTRNEQRKEMGFREAQIRATADLGVDDDHWIDNFGKVIPGRRPAPKTEKTYVDANGYIQCGDKPDESGDGLRGWLNTVDLEHDEEVRAALGENIYFEEQIKIDGDDILLIGQLENTGWLVKSRSDKGTDSFTTIHSDPPWISFHTLRSASFGDRPRRYPKLASSNIGSKIGSNRLSSAC